MEDRDEDIRVSNTGFLPIVSAYAARIGLVEEIDRLLHCPTHLRQFEKIKLGI
jgi:hypothetical protein